MQLNMPLDDNDFYWKKRLPAHMSELFGDTDNAFVPRSKVDLNAALTTI
jgi:hypothetical protein